MTGRLEGGNVLALGNSITFGGGLNQTYPQRLQAMLGSAYRVTNSGHPSQTTVDLTAAFSTWAQQYYLPGKRNVVLLSEVCNDLIVNGASEAQARAHMQTLIASARANGWEAWFCTTLQRTDFSAEQASTAMAINAFFAESPSEHDGLVDWTAHPSLDDPADANFFPDGIHPNDNGARAIAEVTFDALT